MEVIMLETFMTRTDDDLGEGLFDSIAWAFEQHVKLPDPGPTVYNSAILFGNEVAPKRIDFYFEKEPTVNSEVAYRWIDGD